MIAKLNIASTIAALVMFLFPWLDIQCSNKTIMTQSGIQTIYGGGSLSKELKELGKEGGKKSAKDDDSTGTAVLVGIALLAVVGALAAAFLILKGNQSVPDQAVGMLCAGALAALVLQLCIGFPVQGKLAESTSEAMKAQRSSDDSFEKAGAGMAAAMIQVKYSPALYLELIALGIPSLMLANTMLEKMKKADGTKS